MAKKTHDPRTGLPFAQARFSPSMNRIYVGKCPYCGKDHEHAPTLRRSDDRGQRMADCFKGEYVLRYED